MAKRYSPKEGIDYNEMFALVAKLNSVRILLSIAVNENWPLRQLDVKNVFLNDNLKKEVYMLPPQGFESRFKTSMYRLRKALYGLK